MATNTGARTGLMIALTGLFAWLTIMGLIWWIYGIGLKGPGAHWTVREVNRGDLALATFPNEAGLQRQGGTFWTKSANSGTPTVGTPNTSGFGQTIAGTLEMSNVDMATEFTNMIQAERGYQANSSVISTADQMLQTIVQMKP